MPSLFLRKPYLNFQMGTRWGCFTDPTYSENALKIKTFISLNFKTILQIKTFKYVSLRGTQHNSNLFSKYFFYLAEN